MSVITDTLINKLANKDFVIHPMREKSITPLGYDLCIGCAINLVRSDDTNNQIYSHPESISVPPKKSCFIVTKEHVWLSGSLVGTLHSLGSFAAKGLIINSTTVDPNWKGQMTFLIYNSTDSLVKLEIGSPFVTLILHRTEATTKSAPPNNPISVAENYGKIYGDKFSSGLNSYLVSSDNNSVKQLFENNVDTAKKYSLFRNIVSSVVFSIKKPFTSFRIFFILILSLSLVPILLLSSFWDTVQPFVHGVEYDTKVLAAQGAAFLSICALIASLSLKK